MPSTLTSRSLFAVLTLSLLALTGCDEASDVPPGGDGVTENEPCTDEACGPAMGAPNYLCDDGVTTAGPGPCERRDDGECGWTMVTCPEPEPCSEEGCQDQPSTCDETWLQPGWDRVCDADSGECVESTAEQAYDCAAEGLICEDGACVAGDTDLCADVVCEPIEGHCVDETMLFGGSPTTCDPGSGECIGEGFPFDCSVDGGTCVDDACVGGAPHCDDLDCEAQGLVCLDGACVEDDQDLCADVLCEDGASSCDGSTAVYGGLYACNPENGECEIYASEGPEDCGQIGLVCVDGACVEGDQGLCADVSCPSTPPFCEGSIAHSGTYQECDPQTGECIMAPGLPPQDCAEQGMVCLEGQCQDPQCTEADCGPMPGMPNSLCDDGVTTAGPSDCEMQEGGDCGWTIVECPDAETCTPGENIEAGDGCNTCVCAESGLVSESFNCTKKACMCETSKECDDGFFCDYPNDDCGVGGMMGNCAAIPLACDPGGVGACGCGSVSTTNACEQQTLGYDVFSYGGCTLGSEETFACGATTCQAATELCTISMNDAPDPDQPLFDNSCSPLDDACGQGDCGCMTIDPSMSCYDETGYTIIFYMGG
jgi:hypothetical protein